MVRNTPDLALQIAVIPKTTSNSIEIRKFSKEVGQGLLGETKLFRMETLVG